MLCYYHKSVYVSVRLYGGDAVRTYRSELEKLFMTSNQASSFNSMSGRKAWASFQFALSSFKENCQENRLFYFFPQTASPVNLFRVTVRTLNANAASNVPPIRDNDEFFNRPTCTVYQLEIHIFLLF